MARTYSHGCIRLSRPLDLAGRAVGGIAGCSKPRIESVYGRDRKLHAALFGKPAS